MKRFRLTKAAKILIVLLVVAMAFGGVAWGVNSGLIKTSKQEKPGANTNNGAIADEDGNVINTDKTDAATINLSLDEWIGWKSIIDANGGLSTKAGSIYDKLGIKVNISIINDATQSSNAMINGSLDAAGYTINRTAFLSQKFKEANFDVIMPFITNYSNGGDGIIAKSNIKTINDLVGAKIGVPEFSEAHTLVIWFVNQSDLTAAEKEEILNNLIFFATPDDAAKAFFAGQIDVAATWEPYLTQAKNMTDAHILFSTASSSSLVMDGILFSKEFAEANVDVVTAFIDGALQAADLYDTDMSTIKTVMPMFATASDEDIKENCASAKLATFADNFRLFERTAKDIFNDMCTVWQFAGEKVNGELVLTLFDDRYLQTLETKYDKNEVPETSNKVVVTEENTQDILDAESLLQKAASVTFIVNTAKFADSAAATTSLDDFIKIAKVLDGTIIEIAGNTDPNPASDPTDEYNVKLSKQRADAVKQYFIMNGISADRIVTVGNGSSNPVADNNTDEGRAANRRTDVSFKCIEN